MLHAGSEPAIPKGDSKEISTCLLGSGNSIVQTQSMLIG